MDGTDRQMAQVVFVGWYTEQKIKTDRYKQILYKPSSVGEKLV